MYLIEVLTFAVQEDQSRQQHLERREEEVHLRQARLVRPLRRRSVRGGRCRAPHALLLEVVPGTLAAAVKQPWLTNSPTSSSNEAPSVAK